MAELPSLVGSASGTQFAHQIPLMTNSNYLLSGNFHNNNSPNYTSYADSRAALDQHRMHAELTAVLRLREVEAEVARLKHHNMITEAMIVNEAMIRRAVSNLGLLSTAATPNTWSR